MKVVKLQCLTFVAALLLLISVVYRPVPVSAQEDERAPQSESEATYTFGQGMRFWLRAKSPEPITAVTLYFNTPEMDSTYVVDLDVEEPSQDAEIEHEISLTQVQLAPFTTVRYWWRVTTEDGTYTVDEQTIDYVDDRFHWHQVKQDGVTVNWTGDDSSLGQAGLDVLAKARLQLETVLPTEITSVRIYIYPSMADLRSALRLTGRDWLGADAMPELDVVLVTAVNPRTAAFDLGQSIPHELSHLLLYRISGSNYENVPRWFDEGLATMFELSPSPSYNVTLRQAVAARVTIPLARLCETFPSGEAEVRLAYAQSVSVLKFIRSEYGNEALRHMISSLADGADCDSVVRRSLGISLAELEALWLEREQPLSPFARFWQANGLWILLIVSGFGVMLLLLLPLRRER